MHLHGSSIFGSLIVHHVICSTLQNHRLLACIPRRVIGLEPSLQSYFLNLRRRFFVFRLRWSRRLENFRSTVERRLETYVLPVLVEVALIVSVLSEHALIPRLLLLRSELIVVFVDLQVALVTGR